MLQSFINAEFYETREKITMQPIGLIQRFLAQAKRFPHKLAVITPEKTLTYRALQHNATRLCQSLRNLGITQESPIAILLPPGIEQIISQMGILMAGGSCVPLDPSMPEARLNMMLTDLQVNWVIVPEPKPELHLNAKQVGYNPLLAFPAQADDIEDIPLSHRTHVLFTSGTTGKPKAVEIEAKGILRLVVDTHYVDFTADDRIACIANPTFDASLFEIWGALLNGATIVVIPKQDVLNIPYFQEALTQQQISIMFITTTLFNLIATRYPSAFCHLRYLVVGGEALTPHPIEQVLDAGSPQHLLNGYGPTESTTFALTYRIEKKDVIGGSIPIGRPIDRTSAFILDDDLHPLPFGEIGQIYIGGEGLARGYWDRDTLNKDVFLMVQLPGEPHPTRLYKTGDRGFQRTDGVFIYAGRMDTQVKMRGHRIELEEIENHLLKSGLLRAATVCLVKKEGEDDFLAAFIIPYHPHHFNPALITQTLQRILPTYMLPRLTVVDDIPLTPTGKVDRNALIAQLPTHTQEVLQPEDANDVTSTLQRLWQTILNLDKIDPEDDFFQLGGSSLQAARLIIDIGRTFKQSFSVQALYNAPTLRTLAEVIEQKKNLSAQDEISQWQHDSLLPDDICPTAMPVIDWAALKNATVLLTGATGFLAAFLLRDLLALPSVGKIICLVRAPDNAFAHQRIQANLAQYDMWQPAFNTRIHALAGDMSQPQLGLDAARYQEMATTCDVVFHLGAHVNYIQPYQAHRAGNIDGTLNILRFVVQGKAKALHYVSTIAAFGPASLLQNISHIYENDDLAPFLMGMKYDSGYSQSKWVVEQLVWQAKARGIPLSVYRPGFIMGDSISGAGNPKDFVARLIRGCIAIGAYPTLPRQRKEFVSVDFASAALLTIAQDPTNLGNAYHLVSPDPAQSIDLEHFFALLVDNGYPLQKLPYNEWVNKLDADPHLNDNPLMPLLPMLSEAVYHQKTRWEVYENMPTYDATNTFRALQAAHSALTFTPMDKPRLALYLQFWRQKGLLPTPLG